MKVRISDLRFDSETQTRCNVPVEVAQDYCESIKLGHKFPPIVVFESSEGLWVGDGHQRIEAHKLAGIEEIEAEILNGTRQDAIWYSCGANKAHGLRFTDADKRKAVELALKIMKDSGKKTSNRQIAEHCGVSEFLVRKISAIKSQPVLNEPQPVLSESIDPSEDCEEESIEVNFTDNDPPKPGSSIPSIKPFEVAISTAVKHMDSIQRHVAKIDLKKPVRYCAELKQVHESLNSALTNFTSWCEKNL